MIKTIPNNELKIELLPSIDDNSKIFKFAMLFNGYENNDSLKANGKEKCARNRENVTEIRSELFFSARASRHCDDDEYLKTYKELLPILINKIKNNENT